MGKHEAAIESLRSEYDGRLLDPVERKHQAKRLYEAIAAVSLWPKKPRILDVGCGAGLKLAFLGDDVCLRVGCDIRSDIFRKKQEDVRGIYFVQASASELPFFNGSFDIVTCISVIEELPDFRSSINSIQPYRSRYQLTQGRQEGLVLCYCWIILRSYPSNQPFEQ